MNEYQKNIEEKYRTFLKDQRDFFDDTHELMAVTNHEEHFENPNYWKILSNITDNPSYWKDRTALDFGCGCGRNIKTLLDLADWERVDGCDISGKNAVFSKRYVGHFYKNKCNTWRNNGFTILDEQDKYDFIMSTIVLQHIPVYDIRFSILLDMYKLLKPQGILSIQFEDMKGSTEYYGNKVEFDENNTNSRVDDVKNIIEDLEKIGFTILETIVTAERVPNTWYIIKATKEQYE